MKKSIYILSGIVIGAVIATSSSAFAAQIKSMIGQKVTGEYTVIVNGKELVNKGAVIAGKTNAPVRDLANALGADLKMDGKTINITSNGTTPSDDQVSVGTSSTKNKYLGGSKESLLMAKDDYENKILKPTMEGRENIIAEIKTLKETEAKGIPVPVLAEKEKQLKEYDEIITKANEELRLVNEALDKLGE
ncbi:copper amine oxidase [Paenibacillus sp.]|jgi:Tol biopolymer transport system component|uniref:copper amine oxidase n=1 Tax=Paenibacillus sp. TaxID=58172 RepID=UPI002826281B|nr:copper amine oxidase [Paenibacillus sp.]MDR0270998.1 copper amine oxidase N-terminal domain-containing protein [Paenibacillus sp.]